MTAKDRVGERAWVAAGVAQCADLDQAAQCFLRISEFESDQLVRCALMESGLMALRRCFKDGQPLVQGQPGRWKGSAMMRKRDALRVLSAELRHSLDDALAAADGVAHRRLSEQSYSVSGDAKNLTINLSSDLPFDEARTFAYIATALSKLIFEQFAPSVLAELVMAHP